MDQKAGYTGAPPTYEAVCQAAPAEGPERQLYLMELCKAWVEEKKQTEEGSQGAFHIQTFGYQISSRDSEKLTGILETIGYRETDEGHADFVLYNTCTVRENANQRVYGHLGYLGTMKKRNPHMMIALCGCMMREPEVVEKIKGSYRFVDLVFGTHNIFKLTELLYRRFGEQKLVVDVWEDTEDIVEDLPNDRKFSFESGVNIMFGCNNLYDYCIVPCVRGQERSRNPEDILSETKRLMADGVVEVILLGQDVSSYRKALETPITFTELLRQVEEIEGLEHIRSMTSYPEDLPDELIKMMKQSKKTYNHLHLPLQSGNIKVLKEMNRRYTKGRFLALAEKIQTAVPGTSLTTDIIVGFPRRTEEDFQDTIDVVRKMRFDSTFTFVYSKRTGTPAASMESQVPEDMVKERFGWLLAEVQSISAELFGRNIHTIQPVLVEDLDDHVDGLVTGRMSNDTVVHFPGDVPPVGKIADVYLEESKGFYYIGHLA